MTLNAEDFTKAAIMGRSIDLLVSQLSSADLEEFKRSNASLGNPVEAQVYQDGEWLIPNSYQRLDLKPWLAEQCQTEGELNRVELEWNLFESKGLVPVLCAVKYLVDVMRENKIVWGGGRGSSVASFILYLIGVHKIHSVNWDLDPTEFLR